MLKCARSLLYENVWGEGLGGGSNRFIVCPRKKNLLPFYSINLKLWGDNATTVIIMSTNVTVRKILFLMTHMTRRWWMMNENVDNNNSNEDNDTVTEDDDDDA